MPMTLETAEALVLDAHGRRPPAAWPTRRIVENAWGEFLDTHDWRWSAGTRTMISLVSGTNRYELPADLGHILVIGGNQTYIQPVELVSWRQLEERRARGLFTPQGAPPYIGAIFWEEQSDGAFLPHLELYPTPAVTQADAFEVSYLPGVGNPEGDADTLTLPYPPFIERVWCEWLRAYTLGVLEPDVASTDVRLAVVKAGSVMSTAIKRDAGTVRRISAPNGAANEGRFRRFSRRWHSG